MSAARPVVESAMDPAGDFPLENLPYGSARRRGTDEPWRLFAAIGDQALDLGASVEAGLLASSGSACQEALRAPLLNPLMALGSSAWMSARRAIQSALTVGASRLGSDAALRSRLLVPRGDLELRVPAAIGDYTDFYCSIHHATNVGSMFRPDQPLLPNYKHLPIGYHGRASSIVIDGTPVRRPFGQIVPVDGQPPIFGPSRLLDYEMELGFFVGTGNEQGTRVAISDAAPRIFGFVLVNDWSARDVQKWEYQPLGPFNAKNFATTISPWVVTTEALEPFRLARVSRGESDPPLLPYLETPRPLLHEIQVEVLLRTQAMRERHTPAHGVSLGTTADLYWSFDQMLAHHTSTGCNLQPGDLIASGTISGATKESRGCMLERTWRGQEPLELPGGEKRAFIQDGDEVILRAWAQREGSARIGFGECSGVVLPARDLGR